MNELEKIIARRIIAEGPISFAAFMEMALYYPDLGYYTSTRDKLGFDGDFFTSCTLTPVFGYALASQLHEMWEKSGINDFTIVEYGAGTGDLCVAVLSYFSRLKNLPGSLNYKIIEISQDLRQLQRSKVPGQVEWVNHIAEISGFSGAVISNELLDNFPVHRVQMAGNLMETKVGFQGDLTRGTFNDVNVPAGNDLRKYFEDLRVQLPAGYRTEVCLDAGSWIAEIAQAMEKGFVMTVDYGYLSGDLYAPQRAGGTLACYHHHKVVDSLYANIGQQDISAHVNFSALALYGMNNGLLLTGFREQGPFLHALGFERLLMDERDTNDPVAALKKESVIMQTVMGEMGKKFKVLVQHKGLPALQLTGFRLPQA